MFTVPTVSVEVSYSMHIFTLTSNVNIHDFILFYWTFNFNISFY